MPLLTGSPQGILVHLEFCIGLRVRVECLTGLLLDLFPLLGLFSHLK